ncbi:class F sortase [Thermogemmatispora carboxidivorans]|uniref:class F sortase n=1 Tax=Thermogemmatispora carboxidivorans TaxID=1382306 RepID=UPI00069938A0|nr:class F sortase [Thermogemmatispora carboxidivorans]
MQGKAKPTCHDYPHGQPGFGSSARRRWLLLLLPVLLVSSGLLAAGCGAVSSPAMDEGTGVERQPPAPVTATATAPAPALSPALPTQLLIPAIGVAAPVERVGLGADGTLATPQQHPWDDVGWYGFGPLPGQQGSAVIAGHLDRPGGYPAVFWNLHLLRPGTALTVVDERGQRWHFRVTAVASYPPARAPLFHIFADRSGRYLNLITCAGTWIPSEHQTTERLVVYSVLQGS